MRKTLFFLIMILFTFTAILSGCAQAQDETSPKRVSQTVKLYYSDQNNEKILPEERRISYLPAEKYEVTLRELIKGPSNPDLSAHISPDTKVYGTIKQNDKIIVDLSREFNRFSGSVDEILAVGSVVNTLTQFEEISEVKILVEGNEYIGPSGQPRGFMKPFDIEAPQRQAREVILYFGNKDATAVVGETREIDITGVTDRAEFIRLVLEELIKGPQNNELSRTIPREVRIRSVNIEDGIAYVDFSEEMHTKHWHGAAGEAMTINSIVNTLTEFEYIEKVKMTVEGEPMAIEHLILDKPVSRNEDMIAR